MKKLLRSKDYSNKKISISKGDYEDLVTGLTKLKIKVENFELLLDRINKTFLMDSCVICGSKDKVEIHHIIPFSEHGDITMPLCRRHHKDMHKFWIYINEIGFTIINKKNIFENKYVKKEVEKIIQKEFVKREKKED